MAVAKRDTSPWSQRPVRNDGVNTVQTRELPLVFKDQSDDLRYSVRFGETILDIAAQFYEGAWWLHWCIMQRNKITLWYDLEPGTEIVIPSRRNIDLTLRARRKGLC